MNKNIGADIVSKAILGKECKTVVVNGKPYFIKPPTIKKIAGAGLALSGCETGDITEAMKDAGKAAEALSWFIKGDDSLTETFKDATLSEVTNALSEAVAMLGIQDFLTLSDLSRSVRRLIANPK